MIAEARRLPVMWAGREPIYGILRLGGFEPVHAKRGALSAPSIHTDEWLDLQTHLVEAAEIAERSRLDAHLAGLTPGPETEAAILAYRPIFPSSP